MICNSSLTVYHYEYDELNRINKWKRFNYENVWWFGGKGASLNKGFDNANDIEIRIPYNQNDDLNINNFKVGDILIQGTLEQDITTQQDLDQHEIYNITSLNNNNFGMNPHIHIGGK